MKRYLVIANLLILAVVFGNTALASAGNTTLLAIGSPRSFDANLASLKYANEDAARMADALRAVGAIDPGRLYLLKDATVAEFWRAAYGIRGAAKPGAAAATSAKLIIYFSGHSDERGLHLSDGLVTKAELHRLLEDASFASKLVMLDSCFAGEIAAKGVTTSPVFELPQAHVDEPNGTVFLAASSGKQMAFESEAMAGGIFTHYLLQGIYGAADFGGDGVVTVDELYQFAYHQTKLQGLTLPQGSGQKPEYISDLRGQGALVVSYPEKASGRLTLGADLSGKVVIARRSGLLVYPVTKTSGAPLTVTIPEGEYDVDVIQDDRSGTSQVRIAAARESMIGGSDVTWGAAKQVARLRGKGNDPGAPMFTGLVGVDGGAYRYMRPGPMLGAGARLGAGDAERAWTLWGMTSLRRNALALDARTGSAETVTAGLELRASPLPRLGGGICLFASLNAGVALQRQRWRLGDDERSYQAGYPQAALGLGIEWESVGIGAWALAWRAEFSFPKDRSGAARTHVLGLFYAR